MLVRPWRDVLTVRVHTPRAGDCNTYLVRNSSNKFYCCIGFLCLIRCDHIICISLLELIITTGAGRTDVGWVDITVQCEEKALLYVLGLPTAAHTDAPFARVP